jgi:hypothetical protein
VKSKSVEKKVRCTVSLILCKKVGILVSFSLLAQNNLQPAAANSDVSRSMKKGTA